LLLSTATTTKTTRTTTILPGIDVNANLIEIKKKLKICAVNTKNVNWERSCDVCFSIFV